MVFQAAPMSMAVELQLEAVARIDEALSRLELARRELVAANQVIEQRTRKAG